MSTRWKNGAHRAVRQPWRKDRSSWIGAYEHRWIGWLDITDVETGPYRRQDALGDVFGWHQ